MDLLANLPKTPPQNSMNLFSQYYKQKGAELKLPKLQRQLSKEKLNSSKFINQNIKQFVPPVVKKTPLEVQKEIYQQSLFCCSARQKKLEEEDLKFFKFSEKIQDNMIQSTKLMGKLDTYVFCGYVNMPE
ncbi:hypothetical protein SS50377_28382 [Spironucleus salmonicida]|uniref:Uncharacterized protein n=1 Tax=Spironucleus salmonicida TaxID=348837 RepID=A0A9P8RUH1_9EUKA|nr:hypothetical protein SS50377_28382 [Spironucleus salmonicida]